MGATWEKVGAYGMGTSPSQPSGIWSAQRSTGLRRSASFLGLGNPDQKSKPFSSLGERFLLGLKLKKSPGINSPFPKDPSLAFLSELRPCQPERLVPVRFRGPSQKTLENRSGSSSLALPSYQAFLGCLQKHLHRRSSFLSQGGGKTSRNGFLNGMCRIQGTIRNIPSWSKVGRRWVM